jgi:hypothetical protein
VSEFFVFAQLGLRHIVGIEAMDHILFLIALAAIYRFRDVKRVLWVITAFTVGHSITLALAVTELFTLPTALIEFLIPVTIVATGVENLLVRNRTGIVEHRYRPVLAGVFGLAHGAGFANYLRDMFVDRVGVPLLGFNLGIEAGQLVVLGCIAILFVAVDRLLASARPMWSVSDAVRMRMVTVSVFGVGVGAVWAVERRPW